MHRLVNIVRMLDAPPPVLQEASTRIEELITLLEPFQSHGMPCGAMLDGNLESYKTGAASPQEVMPYSPLIGPLNPIAPGFEFRYVGPRIEGSGRFPPIFAGPPNTAHGGLVAAVFDELLTAVVMRNGPVAFTGTLSIRYSRRIEIGHEVTLTADLISRDGRKILTRGEMHQHGRLAATAEAIFIEAQS